MSSTLFLSFVADTDGEDCILGARFFGTSRYGVSHGHLSFSLSSNMIIHHEYQRQRLDGVLQCRATPTANRPAGFEAPCAVIGASFITLSPHKVLGGIGQDEAPLSHRFRPSAGIEREMGFEQDCQYVGDTKTCFTRLKRPSLSLSF